MINVDADKARWLALRRNYITGTDAAVLMGVSPWGSIDKLIDDKIHGAPPFDNVSMCWGRFLEDSNRRAFSLITGLATESFHDFVALDEHRLGATMDAKIVGVDGPVTTDPWYVDWRQGSREQVVELLGVHGWLPMELKQSKSSSRRYWKHGVPEYYWWQVQVQAFVNHKPAVVLVSKLDMHEMNAYVVMRDDLAISLLQTNTDAFFKTVDRLRAEMESR